MGKKKTIAVVIPARNRADFAQEAVLSVVNQNLPENVNLEILVVDNKSNPPLKKFLGKRFPEVRIIRSKGYDSPGGTRNWGIKHAKGDYIAFLDNDDQWEKDFLMKSIEAIKKSKAPAVMCIVKPYFYGPYSISERVKLLFLNFIRDVSLLLSYLLNNGKLPKSGFYLCQISHMLFDRKYLTNIKFNEQAIAAEDWEYMVGATKEGEVQIILEPLVKFRYEMRSNTNTQEVREKKWNAYNDLLKRIPKSHKYGVFHKLFLQYIKMYS